MKKPRPRIFSENNWKFDSLECFVASQKKLIKVGKIKTLNSSPRSWCHYGFRVDTQKSMAEGTSSHSLLFISIDSV